MPFRIYWLCGVLLLLMLVLFRGKSPAEEGFFRNVSLRTKYRSNQRHSYNAVDGTREKNDSAPFDWKSHVRFFVLGAQKSGTTSLYKYMGQHPQIEPSVKKETRCFQVDYKPSDPFCERYFANPRFRHQADDYITGDFSPGYLWKGESTIPRIQRTYPDARFIITLRHPIERAVSQFRMHKRNKKFPENITFESLCMEELEIMRQEGLFPYWNFPTDMELTGNTTQDLNHLQDWYMEASVNQTDFAAFFSSSAMIRAWKNLLDVKSKSRGMVQKGLYALQIQRWMHAFAREQFLVVSLEETARELQAVMQRIHAHLGLPHVPINDTAPVNTGGDAASLVLSDRMRRILTKVYQPFDGVLPAVVGDENWRNPWTL